jgi:hypothetical protein
LISLISRGIFYRFIETGSIYFPQKTPGDEKKNKFDQSVQLIDWINK